MSSWNTSIDAGDNPVPVPTPPSLKTTEATASEAFTASPSDITTIDIPKDAPVVTVPEIKPYLASVVPYSGPFKECDSISITNAGIQKPDYCCNNGNVGLIKFAAIYTVIVQKSTTESQSLDLCAPCTTHMEQQYADSAEA